MSSFTVKHDNVGRHINTMPLTEKHEANWSKSSFAIEGLDNIDPSNYISTGTEKFSINMRGPIDLIGCNQGSTEGFVNPFIEAYFNQKSLDTTKCLKKNTNIIAVVSRHVGMNVNKPQMKQVKSRSYKMSYFVSY